MHVPKKVNRIINIIFNAQVSAESMGGGDKIVICISNELQEIGFSINFLGSPEGIGMAKNNIQNLSFVTLNKFTVKHFGFLKTYMLRILFSPTILIKKTDNKSIVWSASDFLPDVLPGFWFKLFNRNSYWVGNMFLRARNPFVGEVEKTFSNILFFISQKISLLLYKLCADRVCVLCQEDFDSTSKYFSSTNRVCLLSGGIDTHFLDSVPDTNQTRYDACFIGRFHSQKGLPSLIKVWAEVNKTLGPKNLAIIGWGNEYENCELMRLVSKSGCKDTIHLLGFKDGVDKVKVLKSSLVLLFPSNFESWGVTVAEALGCKVPVVAFELKQIKQNFTEGVLWSKDFDEFVKKTTQLLSNNVERDKIAEKAYEFSKKLDWKYSAEKLIKNINF